MNSKTRKRNSLLRSLELVRRHNRRMGLTDLIALLYIAENEGLYLTQLAYLAGLLTPTASRIARSLASEGDEEALSPFYGLVKIASLPGDYRKRLTLSDAGRALCDSIDEIIRAPVPISADGSQLRSRGEVEHGGRQGDHS
jgi:hypothetical protein